MNIVQIAGGELRIPVEKGGGLEAYILNLSRCLTEAGHNTTILDRKYSLADPDVEHIDGVKVVRLKARQFPIPNTTIRLTLNYISFSRQVRKYLAENDFDIVHAHVSIIGLWLAVVSRELRKKLFYTSHATRRGKKSRNLLDKQAIALENRLVRCVRTAVMLNESIKEELINDAKVQTERIALLPMGTDTTIFNPAIDVGDINRRYGLEEKTNILFVGRIREDKGIVYLIEAANILVKGLGYRDIQFLLVGPTEEFISQSSDGSPYLFKVRQLIKNYGLRQVVRLTGAVPLDDLRHLYAACDIFVLPSLTEAAPQAVIEAMASGKPVIGTRVGAIPTQLAEGQSGFLIDPANAKQLAERLKYLIDNPDERKRMGAFGRKLAEEKHDWGKVTEKLLEIYKVSLGVKNI